MQQLPQIQTIDTVKPLQMYYAAQQQRRRDELANQQMQVQQANLQQMALKNQEWQAGAEERENERIRKSIENDNGFRDEMSKYAASLDPNAPDFRPKLDHMINAGADYLVNEHGVSPEKAAAMKKSLYDRGIATPEGFNKIMGIKPTEPEKPPEPSDTDDYRDLMAEQYKLDHGVDPEPGQLAEYMISYRRQQSGEAYGVERAKGEAKADVAIRLERNKKFGEQVAIIDTAQQVAEAKGEITPVAKKDNAKRGVSGELQKLTGHYIDLDSLGGIVNIENTSQENLFASLKASGPGQVIGKVFGTDEQSFRNSITAIKPLLLNNIRQASEMGARGLDSEKELEFYLQAATDEKRDIQANMEAIAVLDEAYGTGEIATSIRENIDSKYKRKLSKESKEFTSKSAPEQITKISDMATRIKSGEDVNTDDLSLEELIQLEQALVK